MSKKSLKNLNKPSKFTRKILSEVDNERFDDAVYVLMHSHAAREVFAWLQYEMHFDDDEFWAQMAYARSLEYISREVAHRAHGRRRCAVSCGTFERLAELLDVPSGTNEFGETYIRTINGWWKI